MIVRYTEIGIRLGRRESGGNIFFLVSSLEKRVKTSRNSRVPFILQKKKNRVIFWTFSERLQNRSKSFNVMKCYFSDVDNCS